MKKCIHANFWVLIAIFSQMGKFLPFGPPFDPPFDPYGAWNKLKISQQVKMDATMEFLIWKSVAMQIF